MTQDKEQFLYLLKIGIKNEKAPASYQFDMGRVFHLAMIHNVLPFIYHAASETEYDLTSIKRMAVSHIGNQIAKNEAFKCLYKKLISECSDLLVLKGPVCAGTYLNPDYRLSSDFDLVVPHDDIEKAREFLKNEGFACNGESCKHPNGLYIELGDKIADGNGNHLKKAEGFFKDSFANSIIINNYNTLSHNDNMVYLLYHAFKHFTGSGFGVRQIIDIVNFYESYRDNINLAVVMEKMSEIGAGDFTKYVFYISNKYFGFELPFDDNFNDKTAELFMEDLLTAGVFGKSSEDRLHSATLVGDAVNGKKSLKGSLFPSYRLMIAKYKILKYLPFLLPLFWFVRIITYAAKSVFGRKSVSPTKTIKIAQERIELMTMLHIIN